MRRLSRLLSLSLVVALCLLVACGRDEPKPPGGSGPTTESGPAGESAIVNFNVTFNVEELVKPAGSTSAIWLGRGPVTISVPAGTTCPTNDIALTAKKGWSWNDQYKHDQDAGQPHWQSVSDFLVGMERCRATSSANDEDNQNPQSLVSMDLLDDVRGILFGRHGNQFCWASCVSTFGGTGTPCPDLCIADEPELPLPAQGAEQAARAERKWTLFREDCTATGASAEDGVIRWTNLQPVSQDPKCLTNEGDQAYVLAAAEGNGFASACVGLFTHGVSEWVDAAEAPPGVDAGPQVRWVVVSGCNYHRVRVADGKVQFNTTPEAEKGCE